MKRGMEKKKACATSSKFYFSNFIKFISVSLLVSPLFPPYCFWENKLSFLMLDPRMGSRMFLTNKMKKNA